jgi:hypothetical protein
MAAWAAAQGTAAPVAILTAVAKRPHPHATQSRTKDAAQAPSASSLVFLASLASQSGLRKTAKCA